jgi:hypothetical protein
VVTSSVLMVAFMVSSLGFIVGGRLARRVAASPGHPGGP